MPSLWVQSLYRPFTQEVHLMILEGILWISGAFMKQIFNSCFIRDRKRTGWLQSSPRQLWWVFSYWIERAWRIEVMELRKEEISPSWSQMLPLEVFSKTVLGHCCCPLNRTLSQDQIWVDRGKKISSCSIIMCHILDGCRLCLCDHSKWPSQYHYGDGTSSTWTVVCCYIYCVLWVKDSWRQIPANSISMLWGEKIKTLAQLSQGTVGSVEDVRITALYPSYHKAGNATWTGHSSAHQDLGELGGHFTNFLSYLEEALTALL